MLIQEFLLMFLIFNSISFLVFFFFLNYFGENEKSKTKFEIQNKYSLKSKKLVIFFHPQINKLF